MSSATTDSMRVLRDLITSNCATGVVCPLVKVGRSRRGVDRSRVKKKEKKLGKKRKRTLEQLAAQVPSSLLEATRGSVSEQKLTSSSMASYFNSH